MTTSAKQGHSYLWHGQIVLAMESGDTEVTVQEIGPLWLGPPRKAPVSELEPRAMRYFRGEVPA